MLFCTGLIAGCADGSAAETSSTPTIISTENEQATPSAEATATATPTPEPTPTPTPEVSHRAACVD